ncbi:MAG: T9SS type A sorting domain-containing protein [Saprospiraceae bacterium]|nr:T9SS type A sorting domain-containing protein [Saprospiraceae bacterium]
MKKLFLLILLSWAGWSELRAQCQCDFQVKMVQDPIDSCCFDVLFCHNTILPTCSLPVQYGPLTIYTNGNPFATGDIATVTSANTSVVTATLQSIHQAVFSTNFVSLNIGCSTQFNLGRICLSSAPSGFVNFSAVMGQPGNPCDIPLTTSQFMVPACSNPVLFEKIYGDAEENRPTAVKAFGDGIYVSGYRVVGGTEYATFTKFDLATGALMWEKQLSTPSRALDFEYDPIADEFLLIGWSSPFPAANNRSFLIRMDDQGVHVFSKFYDQLGRESFNRIVRHPNPTNPNFPFYILGRKNPANFQFQFNDEVVLFNLDNSGSFNWLREYPYTTNPTDDEFSLGLVPYTNGDLILTGTTVSNDGALVKINGTTGAANLYRFTNQALDIYDAILHPCDGRLIIVGEDWATHQAFVAVLMEAAPPAPCGFNTPPGNSSLEFMDIVNFKDIWIDRLGDIYVIGENKSTGQLPYQVVHKLNYNCHAGASVLTAAWAKYLYDPLYPEIDFDNGNISVTPAHDRIFYADARLKNPSFFGTWDMLVGAYDLNLTSGCEIGFPVNTMVLPLTSSCIPLTPNTITTEPPYISPICEDLDYCCTNFCSSSPCTADFTWTLGNCFDVQLTASSSSCFVGTYTYDWDFNGDSVPDVTSNNPVLNYNFCGGGLFNICVTVTDPFGCAATICKPVNVNNCNGCGVIVSSNIFCATVDDDTYQLHIVAAPTHPGLTNCSFVLTNISPAVTIVAGPIYTPVGGSSPNVNIDVIFTLTGKLPASLNFTVDMTCTCPTGVGSFTCPISGSSPMVCCKTILVDDQIVCKDDPVLNVPILPDWGTPLCITQVTWYVQPKPANGICPTQATGGTIYQDNITNVLEPLHLYPQSMTGDVCVYAVVHTTDGPCTLLTTNVACIRLCAPTTCTVAGYDYCYTGTCITPGPLMPVFNSPPNACISTVEWCDPSGIVVSNSLTYNPTECLSMSNPLVDCYEDFFYTLKLTDLCGTRTCQARIRLYSDDAPKGKLEVLPFEANTLCPNEDVTLHFTPGCDSDVPKTWTWQTRPCDPPGACTPFNGPGSMSDNWFTNILPQSAYYCVETNNGVCPVDTVQLLLEVKDPLAITSFTALPDPCHELQVDLDISWTPCTVAGCPPGTPCSPCSTTVEWYKDKMLVGVTNEQPGVTSSSFIYANPPIPGFYWAVVKDDCCPNNTDTSFVITIDPACVPQIDGPCFICDNNVEKLNGSVVVPVCYTCPNACTYSWSGPGITGSANQPNVQVNQPGVYTLTTSCMDTYGQVCIKSTTYNLPACSSVTSCPMFVCCDDESAFSENIQNAVTVTSNNAEHRATVSIGDLPACDIISSIDWGDGEIQAGPFTSGTAVEHTYAENGDFEIAIHAEEYNSLTQPPSVCFDTTITVTQTLRTIVGYQVVAVVCVTSQDENGNLIDGVWAIFYECTNDGGTPATAVFHMENAVLVPTSFPDPDVVLTDSLGNPVTDALGNEIVLSPNAGVAAKIEGISPAPLGYKWLGLQSNALTPSGALTQTSQDFKITLHWDTLPNGSQDSTGAFWASDDKDDLYGELVTDAFTELGAFTLVGTSNPASVTAIHLFPNPSSGKLTLEFKGAIPMAGQVQILDLLGRTLRTETLQPGSMTHSFSLEAMPAGVYFVKVLDGGEPVWAQKVVKQ